MRVGTFAMAACLITGSAWGASAPDATSTSDRDRMRTWSIDKDKLQQSLGTGQERAYYRQALEKAGFWITSVNYDRPDYLEYEIVRAGETYEVQIDFNRSSNRSTKVDVTTNAYRTAATEQALGQADYRYTYPSAPTSNPDRYSERMRTRQGAGEKASLQKTLAVGQDRSFYRPALEKMGYKITAVNYDRPDYVELEVVKGGSSYEVQIDFDQGSSKSTKVDVTSNMWRADATKQEMSAARAR